MAKKVKKAKYPETIYVYREKDGEYEYLIAEEDIDNLEEGEIAIYKFECTKKVKINTILE